MEPQSKTLQLIRNPVTADTIHSENLRPLTSGSKSRLALGTIDDGPLFDTGDITDELDTTVRKSGEKATRETTRKKTTCGQWKSRPTRRIWPLGQE